MGKIRFKAILPSLISSVSAYFIALSLGAHPERFHFAPSPEFTFTLVWKSALIAIVGALLSIIFCFSLRYCAKLFKRLIKNEYLRIAVGGAVIVILTLVVGCRDYSGAGVDIIERIFTEGKCRPEAFALKLVFTTIAVAAGFKGGEIIPTLFIGAAFGATAAMLLGTVPAFGAAVGMTALFCGVTNCPVASALLAGEMFSWHGMPYILITAIISFLISGRISLYPRKKLMALKSCFKAQNISINF